LSNKPVPPMSLDAMRAIIYADRDELYRGPGAYTAMELADGCSTRTATRHAMSAAERGELVEVRVERTDRQGKTYTARAWVAKAVYDEWANSENAEKLGDVDKER